MKEHFCEMKDKISRSAPESDSSVVSWINVIEIHDIERIEALGLRFGLHAMTMEDIVPIIWPSG
jgi:magnesium transporter